MQEEIIFKKGEETMLDTLMLNCGHHISCCNNGFGCLHPDNQDDRNCPEKNGCHGCFSFECPIAYQKNPDEDDENCRYGDETVMVLTEDVLKHQNGSLIEGKR